MNKTLYQELGLKRENSVLKSVFITNEKTSEGYPIIIAEPYDQTFINATANVSKYDKTVNYIMKNIYNNFEEDVWLIIYTDNFSQSEILVSEYYMKSYGLID